MWSILVEKAYAKAYGGYNNIGSGGQGHYALFDLTGAPSEVLYFFQIDIRTGEKKKSKKRLQLEKSEIDEIFERVYAYDLSKYIMTCGTRGFTQNETLEYNKKVKDRNESIKVKQQKFLKLKEKAIEINKKGNFQSLTSKEKNILDEYNAEVTIYNKFQKKNKRIEKDFGNGLYSTHA